MLIDVTATQRELNDIANKAISVYGRIEVLVRNAGYTQFGTVNGTSRCRRAIVQRDRPVGIKSLLFEPGTFQTDLLSQQNSKSAAGKFEDYKALTESLTS
ncbi:hypothetical protein N7467_009807 [Penicillium canescens]|nr:hypothetical protein N7467_009807 [Penicillium canescens]